MTPQTLQPNQTIWMLWLQGWASAPELAQSARQSWQKCNPGWTVQALDAQSAIRAFGDSPPETLLRSDLPRETYSDVLRVELLARFGGVWADATTICGKPLDDWLPLHEAPRGYFAFSRPGPDRIIASWFMSAKVGDYLITRLRDAVRAYWHGRTERDDYFWLHGIFEQLDLTDPEFARLWALGPHIPARQRFHFAPGAPRLTQSPTAADLSALDSGEWPVFKLTNKHQGPFPEGSLFHHLCHYQPNGIAPQ